MITLPTPKAGKVTNIIHLSDIHIRDGDKDKSRYDEYLYCFNKLFDELSQMQNMDSTIIVITGDIFHQKNKLDSLSVELFNRLINGLASFTLTLIIYGNHDYKQESPDIPNTISSLLYANENPNIVFLNDSGHYSLANIEIGYLALVDVLNDKDTSGKKSNTLMFPSANVLNNDKIKVALFHGDVNGNISAFNGYNIGIFGDIHKQQIHNIDNNGNWISDKFVWGYSGSLIQQDFGEMPLSQGILVWDLDNKNTKSILIDTSVYRTYITKGENDNYYMLCDGYKLPLRTFLDNISIADLKIRMIIRIKNKVSLEDIDKVRREIGIYNCVDAYILNDYFPVNAPKQIALTKLNEDVTSQYNLETINSYATWYQYIKESNVLNKDALTYCENIMRDLSTLTIANYDNEKLNKAIQSYNAVVSASDCSEKKPLSFKLIKWSNLYCYGENNWFNFENDTKQIYVINGKNDYGKSSFFDIICLGLFNEFVPSREIKSYSKMIINNITNKPANVEIYFTLGNNYYMIIRKFGTKSDTNTKRTIESKLYLMNNENSVFELIKSGPKLVDEFIANEIGLFNDFLLTTMITQNFDRELFALSSEEQIAYIDKLVKIDKIKEFINVLHVAKNQYSDYLKVIDKSNTAISQIFEVMLPVCNNYEETKCKLDNAISELKDINESINVIEVINGHVNAFCENDMKMSESEINDELAKLESLGKFNLQEHNVIMTEYNNKGKEITTYMTLNKNITDFEMCCVDNYNIDYHLNKIKELGKILLDINADIYYYVKHAKYTENDFISYKRQYNDMLKDFNINSNIISHIVDNGIINTKLQDIIVSDYNRITNKLQHNYKLEEIKSRDFLLKMIANFEKQYNDYNGITTNNQNIFPLTYDVHSIVKNKKYDDICEYVELIKTNNIYRYMIDPKYCKIIENYRIYKSLLFKISKIERMKNPYNENCECCRNQIWKKALDKYNKRLKRVYDVLVAEIGNDFSNIEEEEQNIKRNKIKYISSVSKYNNYVMAKMAIDQMQYYSNKNYEYICDNICELNLILNEFDKLFITVDDKIYVKYFVICCINAFTLMTDAKKYVDDINNLNAKSKQIEQEMRECNYTLKFIYSRKCDELKNERDVLIAKINEMNKLRDVDSKISKYKRLLLAINDKTQLQLLNSRRESIIRSIAIYETEIAECLRQQSKHFKINSQLSEQLAISNEINKRLDAITIIINKLESYKRNLYEHKILPNIVENVNRIIYSVVDNDYYRLDYRVQTTGNSKNISTINWFLHNNVDIIPIKFCGGFRKFLTSLTLRISINALGGTIINCKQLFLDEGFVSADSYNLDKIPDYLKSLLTIYDNIILVSHLDIIKQCGTTVVNIVRNNNKRISLLQYGDNMNYQLNNICASANSGNDSCEKKVTISGNLIATNNNGKNRCQSLTANNTQCSKCAKDNSLYCSQHISKPKIMSG